MAFLKRLLRALPLLLISPFLALFSAIALLLTDLFSRSWQAKAPAPQSLPTNVGQTLSSVNLDPPSAGIPNWNGKDLLEKYLPSVVEAFSTSPANEIIVVDDGSTDGSVE